MTSPAFTRRRFAAVLAAPAALAWTPPALAHRSHLGLTRLEASGDGRRWEIEHHFHQHDALEVLHRLAATRSVTLASDEGRAHLALHVERNFRLLDPAGRPLALEMVGVDLGSDSLVVYQQCPLPTPGTYRVRCTLFQGYLEDQSTDFSIALGAQTRIIRLSAGNPEASFTTV